MKKKGKKKIWFLIGGGVMMPLLILGGLIIKKPKTNVEDNIITEEIVNEIDKTTEEKSYITETSYNGYKELDPLVFAYPFSKIGIAYISNKELVKNLEEERLEGLQERVEAFVKEYFELNSRDLIHGYMEKKEKLNNFFIQKEEFINENGVGKKGTIYVEDYIMDIANAELTTDVTYTTDKCLVFEDMIYYVRGVMEITVYDCAAKTDLKEYYPWDVKKGKTYKVILDIGLRPNDSMKPDTYIISKIDFIDFFEKEM